MSSSGAGSPGVARAPAPSGYVAPSCTSFHSIRSVSETAALSVSRYAEGLELIGAEMGADGAVPVRQLDRGIGASTAGLEAPQNEIVAVLGALDYRDHDGVGVDRTYESFCFNGPGWNDSINAIGG